MSITSDIRTYADTALEQGKQVLDQAQSQLSAVTEQANGFVTKITTQAEKAINLDAIKAAVEPYLDQADRYTHGVTDRASGVYASVMGDKRVAKIVTTAESLSGAVVGTVQQRVQQSVVTLTKRDVNPATTKVRTSRAPAKPATTRPAARTTAKPTARKSPAKTPAPKAALKA